MSTTPTTTTAPIMVIYDMILATDCIGGIAKEGKIPWRNAQDLEKFRSITTAMEKDQIVSNICIMGRKTMESIPPNRKKFWGSPERTFIVLSKNGIGPEHYDLVRDGTIQVVNSYENAHRIIAFLKRACLEQRDFRTKDFGVFVIGGADVYNDFIQNKVPGFQLRFLYHTVMGATSYGCDRLVDFHYNAHYMDTIDTELFDDFTFTTFKAAGLKPKILIEKQAAAKLPMIITKEKPDPTFGHPFQQGMTIFCNSLEAMQLYKQAMSSPEAYEKATGRKAALGEGITLTFTEPTVDLTVNPPVHVNPPTVFKESESDDDAIAQLTKTMKEKKIPGHVCAHALEHVKPRTCLNSTITGCTETVSIFGTSPWCVKCVSESKLYM